jgi:hypothetical protein
MKNFSEKIYVLILVAFYSVASFAYIFLVTFVVIPKDNIRVVDTTIGFLMGTVITTIITYYLGSSKGSSDKNKIIKTDSLTEQ